MKSILFGLITLLSTVTLFAQRQSDLKFTLLSPPEGQVYRKNDVVEISMEFKNMGQTNWQVNDSIGWTINIAEGTFLLRANRVVPPNDTLMVKVSTAPLTLDTNWTIDACGAAIFINSAGANHITDTDSTNNQDCNSIEFKKTVVSVNDINATIKTVTVYPNPASNEIAFNFDGFANKSFDVQIFDITGRLVLSKSYNDKDDSKRIDVQNLSNGLFQIHISQEGRRYVGKFSKQ